MRIFKGMKREMALFFLIISLIALGLGMSDGIFANYFKDAYHIDAATRGFIEFPRELPGMLCMFIITALSSLGDVRLAIIAQVLSCVGLMALGLLTPPFAVMLVFLFVNSMGMHLFMPLSDGIGLHIAESPEMAGKHMGQYNGVRTAFGMLAAIVVFVGFRVGWFSFTTNIKWIFLIGSVFFIAALVLLLRLKRVMGNDTKSAKIKLLLRKEYRFFYILALMNGVQKQVVHVYAPWVLIDLLGKGADTMALLSIAGSFIGIFFIPMMGRLTDRLGPKVMLFAEALAYITVNLLYVVTSGALHTGRLSAVGWVGIAIMALFIINRMTTQLALVRVVYLNRIAAPNEVTRTLSTGVSMDHVVSITCAFLGGLAWQAWGPQYVFLIAAILSLINLCVAFCVPRKADLAGMARE